MAIDKRPNILFICADQQQWDKCGFNGHPLVRTPNLDRLAESSANFKCCYSNSPVCAPARASMFTGGLPSDVGAYCNSLPFDGNAPTFGHIARQAGYNCVALGKLDFRENTDYGFREINTTHGHDKNPDITSLFRNPLCRRPGYARVGAGCARDEKSRDWKTVERTIDLLNETCREDNSSWLIYTGWNLPHPPFKGRRDLYESYPLEKIDAPETRNDQAGPEHPVIWLNRWHQCAPASRDENDVRSARAAYYAMITELDEMVGEMLSELDRTGQRDNTYIIFTSDHAEMLGEHNLFLKNTPFEACARVPLLISGPGLPNGAAIDAPVSLMDIHSTIADIAGREPGEGNRGRSLLPLARGETKSHQPVIMELNTERLITGVFTVRDGDWKYNHYVDYPGQLFNLRNDPGEWNDLIDNPDCSDALDRLREILYGAVDPERINDEAFAAQSRKLDELAGDGDEEHLAGILRSRLGDEQARYFARRYFNRRDSLVPA